ncbi:MAG: asparagine synthetase B [Nitrospinaceae bacterium]|nr:MAG: asparagine synthetase B [Nitrospinaceae bacterium]
MISAGERYVIAFNGEVYNFSALRQELDSLWEKRESGIRERWRGHSDTEVMLAAIEQWGIENAVKKFIGMFAFALWDKKDQLLYLVRDRLGIKSLYYGWQGNSFIFGSELKAIKEHPRFEKKINRDAITLLMRYNYIPAPHSIYKGIHKLLPGHILKLSAKENPNTAPESHCYWSAREVAENGISNPFTGSEEEAVQQLDSILRDSVKLRMASDVPLGAFLSGGIDSSTVVALMHAQSTQPVKTFSIGFYEEGYNEAQYAREIAKYLGTDHTELYVAPEQAMAVIPRMPTLYDEPFSDSSQIPTFLVSQLAKKHVTVSLSGDGGDELFWGYDRYNVGRKLWKMIGWMPAGGRKLLGQFISSIPESTFDQCLGWLYPAMNKNAHFKSIGRKLHSMSRVLETGTSNSLYFRLISHWKEPESLVIGATEPTTVLSNGNPSGKISDFSQKMMFLDTITYLPDDILTKVDRASMGVSLEARVPLLDHRVVEFAWRVPLDMKLKKGQVKPLLKQVLFKYVPKELIERPKKGFSVPVGSWLKGPLKEWAEELLCERRLREEGFFDPAPIRKIWAEHLAGGSGWKLHLWDVLMFQAWLENQNQISKECLDFQTGTHG